jgi:hypothetical protein
VQTRARQQHGQRHLPQWIITCENVKKAEADSEPSRKQSEERKLCVFFQIRKGSIKHFDCLHLKPYSRSTSDNSLLGGFRFRYWRPAQWPANCVVIIDKLRGQVIEQRGVMAMM